MPLWPGQQVTLCLPTQGGNKPLQLDAIYIGGSGPATYPEVCIELLWGTIRGKDAAGRPAPNTPVRIRMHVPNAWVRPRTEEKP